MVKHSGDLNVSDDRNEQISGEASGHSGPTIPDSAAAEPVPASGAVSMEQDASGLLMDNGAATETTAASETAKAAAAPDVKAAAPSSRDITIMSPTRRQSWERESSFAPEPEAEQIARKAGLFGKRRVAALAAVIALATAAGAVGGALATATLSAGGDAGKSSIQTKVLDEQMLRIESDLAALKTSVEHSAKLNVAQASKTSDRLDKIEKAQAEPAAKLAKLSEAVDKLRAAPTVVAAAPAAGAPAPAAAPGAAKEVTGSIPTPAPKPEVRRLPTVDGWVLRDVVDGGALIEGREGVYEVYAGDPVPGLGRVDAVRKQDGRWVVVTSRGLIVAR